MPFFSTRNLVYDTRLHGERKYTSKISVWSVEINLVVRRAADHVRARCEAWPVRANASTPAAVMYRQLYAPAHITGVFKADNKLSGAQLCHPSPLHALAPIWVARNSKYFFSFIYRRTRTRTGATGPLRLECKSSFSLVWTSFTVAHRRQESTLRLGPS